MREHFPGADDYVRAVQDPARTLVDASLGSAVFPVHSLLGVPMPASGSSAVVFRAIINGQDQALRFFTRHEASNQARYQALNVHFTSHGIAPSMATSEWIDDAIRVNGQTWPAVRMQWVNGRTLDAYINDLVDDHDTDNLSRLAAAWLALIRHLQNSGFAHGDLQHGNVLVDHTGTLRLVDFDCAWLDEFSAQPPPTELGHRNYQRTDASWGRWMDTFPALVIHTSLLALAQKPGLWKAMHNGENLIFETSDFAASANTRAWIELDQLADKNLAPAIARLKRCCDRDWRPTSLNASLKPQWWSTATHPEEPGSPAAAESSPGSMALLAPKLIQHSMTPGAATPLPPTPVPSRQWYKALGPASASRPTAGGTPTASSSAARQGAVRTSPSARARSGKTRRIVGAIVTLVVLAALLTWAGITFFSGGGLRLEAAGTVGDHPFSPDFRTSGSALAGSVLLSSMPSTASSPSGVVGSTEELYRSTKGQSDCDRSGIADYLDQHSDVERAWVTAIMSETDTSVRGALPTSADGVRTYLESLTPVLLRADTLATDFDLDGDTATPRPAVLQAGTAVLIDSYGIPRLRCIAGSPLTSPPPPPATADLEPSGDPWPGFEDRTAIRLIPAVTAMHQFGLINFVGMPLRRPAGTTGETDIDQTPDTAALDGTYTVHLTLIQCTYNQSCGGDYDTTYKVYNCGDNHCLAQDLEDKPDWDGELSVTFANGNWNGSAPDMGDAGTCSDVARPTTTFIQLTPSGATVESDGTWTVTGVTGSKLAQSQPVTGCDAVDGETYRLTGERS